MEKFFNKFWSRVPEQIYDMVSDIDARLRARVEELPQKYEQRYRSITYTVKQDYHLAIISDDYPDSEHEFNSVRIVIDEKGNIKDTGFYQREQERILTSDLSKIIRVYKFSRDH